MKKFVRTVAVLLLVLILTSFCILCYQLTTPKVIASQPRMTSEEFCDKALYVAENVKTLYVMGGYGQPLNEWGKNYSYNSFEYNRRPDRAGYIEQADENTFGFDCVCFIKGLLWGFNADNTQHFGGSIYGNNGVHDFSCEQMINDHCPDKSSDFSNIEPGEVLYMPGHVGMYAGNGIVVESTPRWGGGVKKTMLGNLPEYRYGNYRDWTYHGHLEYIDYSNIPDEPETPTEPEQEEVDVDIQELAQLGVELHEKVEELNLLIAQMGGGEG